MVIANAVQKSFGLQNHDLELLVSENELFMPNATTRLFSKAVHINSGDIVFDIGSGVGPLAIWAAKEPSSKVYAVEIVEEQCELLEKNILGLYELKKEITQREMDYDELRVALVFTDRSSTTPGITILKRELRNN